MKKLSMLGIVGGAALLAAVPFSLQWSQENVGPAVPLLTVSQANAQYYYGPYRRHVRRVYRRGYRRASYGYPYYYGGILSTLFLWRILSSVLISGHVGMCVECIVVHKKPFGQMRAR